MLKSIKKRTAATHLSDTKDNQVQSSAVSKKTEIVDRPPKLSDRYIVICPAFFDEVLKPSLNFIDQIEIREVGITYKKQPEDIWQDWAKSPVTELSAEIWQHQDHSEKLVFVPHQGRLYCCEDIMEVARLVEEIKTAEACKIIPNV